MGGAYRGGRMQGRLGHARKVKPLLGAVVQPLQQFFQLEAASGVVLLASAVAAFLWANVAGVTYDSVFNSPLVLGAGGEVARLTVRELINDGLMTVFFFVVGMEIKRE